MKYRQIVIVGFLFLAAAPVAAEPTLQFQDLPRDVREVALNARKSCKELNPEQTFVDMQGIQILSLKADGARDIVVDNEGLCGSHMAGANCSNRGCDMRIYKEVSRGQWRKVFQEHLHAKFLAIDWQQTRLQLLVMSIYAGDPRCQPDPRKNYTSGMSCNLIATYRNDQWSWQKIK